MSDRRRPLPWFVRRLCGVPVHYPKCTLIGLLALSCLVGLGSLSIEFDPSTERVFPDGHWAVETYQDFRTTFGGDEAIFICFDTDPSNQDVFNRDDLTACARIAREAEKIEGVREAFSLADMPLLVYQPDPILFMVPVLQRGLPPDPAMATDEQIDRLRERTPEFFNRVIVSEDRRSTSIVLRLETLPPGVEGAKANQQLVDDVRALVERHEGQSGRRFYVAGSPLIKANIMESIQGDLINFTGPLLLIAMIVSALVLRSLQGMAMVLAVLLISLDLTVGAMGHLGIPLDPMTTLVPVLILVIGVADSLHLLVEQRAQAARLGPHADGRTTIREALQHVFVPCLLTSVTTAIGFGSLVTSDVPPIRRFGAAAAIASLVAFAVTMIFIPACAALLRSPKPANGGRVRGTERISRLVQRFPVLALVFGCGLTVVVGLGWLKVVPNTDFLRFFPPEDRLVHDVDAIQERFVGVAPCELLVVAKPGASRDPRVLKAMYELERELERELDFVDMAFSVSDCVAVANAEMQGKRGQPQVPETKQEIQQVESILERMAGDDDLPLEQLVSPPNETHPDHEWLRISVRARAVGSARFAELIAKVEEIAKRENLAELGIEVKPTGTSVVFSQTADTIMTGQIKSFGWAFLTITIVMVLALRSIRLGLLSTIPNIIPIVCLLGAMGYLGIPFNSFNSMVASIALGIAVDDTIHILSGFKRFSAELPLRTAVGETIAHEGAALLSTSTVLFCGFSVLLFATFLPTTHFGLLTAVAIGSALLGDLVVLPALLILLPVRPKRRRRACRSRS